MPRTPHAHIRILSLVRIADVIDEPPPNFLFYKGHEEKMIFTGDDVLELPLPDHDRVNLYDAQMFAIYRSKQELYMLTDC